MVLLLQSHTMPTDNCSLSIELRDTQEDVAWNLHEHPMSQDRIASGLKQVCKDTRNNENHHMFQDSLISLANGSFVSAFSNIFGLPSFRFHQPSISESKTVVNLDALLLIPWVSSSSSSSSSSPSSHCKSWTKASNVQINFQLVFRGFHF